MATQCTHCGQMLPRDDARFCSNCGTLVPDHPFSPQSLSLSKDAPDSSAGQAHKSKSALREQIAQQSHFQPPRRPRPVQDDPPPWIAELNTVEHGVPAEGDAEREKQLSEEVVADRLAEMPTTSLSNVESEQASQVVSADRKEEEPLDPIQLDPPVSEPISAQPQVQPGLQSPQGPVRQPLVAGQYPSTPAPSPRQAGQEPGWSQKPSSSAFVLPIRYSRGRVPLLFTIVLLCLLLVGGLWAWIYVFQPFSVPQVTQPQQSFQDASLGISLSYPRGWNVQLNHKSGSVLFADSTHTAQFRIVTLAANGQDVGQYLLQEAKQLGVAVPKPGVPLSFGGATWQQTQGSIVQNGANYTETLLVTVHRNRLYSIIQQAPQATYTDEEQVVFSRIRSAFRFLMI